MPAAKQRTRAGDAGPLRTPQDYAALVNSLLKTFAERGGPVAEQCSLVARWLDDFACWLLHEQQFLLETNAPDLAVELKPKKLAVLLDTLAKTSALLQAVTRAPPETPHAAAALIHARRERSESNVQDE